MAKNDKTETKAPTTAAAPAGVDIEAIKKQIASQTEGMSERTEDVVGYWLPEACPINCIPRSVKLFDSGIDAGKPSVLIAAELLAPTVVQNSDKEQLMAKKGEIVGIWYKPGMRGIRECGGVATYIEDTKKTKDVGKGNPMRIFSVKSKNGGKLIPVSDDTRVKSAGVKTPFDVVGGSPNATGVPRGPDYESDSDDGGPPF